MIRLPKFEYLSPATIEEACKTLDQCGHEGELIAGGTNVIVSAKLRTIKPRCLISLKRVNGLQGITYQAEEGLKVGAMTPLEEIRKNPVIVQHYRALAQAAAAVGTPQIRRMGTLGGNLCLDTRCFFYNQSAQWRRHRPVCFKMGGDVCHVVPAGRRCYANFSADTPPALMALDARAKLVSTKGARWIALKDLYTGDGKSPIAVRAGELLTEILLPRATHQTSVYLKYRIRKAIDFPLVGIAVRIKWNGSESRCENARIVLNAVGPAPVAVVEAEQVLENGPLNHQAALNAADVTARFALPVANVDSTPMYRRQIAGILTLKALEDLTKEVSHKRKG
jgi:4-hydroxybenzoyl-CoA reductase subunit beta